MPYAAWTASTAYAIGTVVRATAVPETGLVFRCVTAGVSAAAEPTWPRVIAIRDSTAATTDDQRLQGYVTDGSVVWAAITQFAEDLQGIAPSAIIELYTLQLFANLHGSDYIYYFHAGANATNTNGQIVFGGIPYLRYPVEVTGFEYNGQGQLPRPTLRVANLFSTITAILQVVNTYSPGNDLLGAKFTRIRTLARYLDAENFTRNNLLFWSEDITQSAYFVIQCTKTSATTVTISSTADPYIGQLVPNLGSIKNRTFTGGVKLRGIGASVGKYVNLYLYSQSANEVFTSIVGPLTSDYQLFTITCTFVTSTNTSVIFRVDPQTSAGQSWSVGQSLNATEWQLNEGASLLAYQRTFNTQNPFGTPDPTAEFPRDEYYIARKSVETRDVVEFELAAAFDLQNVYAPRRLAINNVCQWEYRGDGCGYTGTSYFDNTDKSVSLASQDSCGKRLKSCSLRFGTVKVTANVTAGSTTVTGLNLGEMQVINVGDQITGYGISAGTTVAAKNMVSPYSITLSQAADRSNSAFTRTGTLAMGGLSMTVSSATGIKTGMTVTGSNVPAGTKVASVSGTTVTLDIDNNPNSQGSATTKTVTHKGKTAIGRFSRLKMTSTSGIQKDDSVQGSGVVKGTKVSYVGPKEVWVSKYVKKDINDSFSATFYRPVTFSSATYTFTPSLSCRIRPEGELPFGAFPGVGTVNS